MPDPNNVPIIGPFFNAADDIERGQIPIFGEVWETLNTVVDFVEYGCFPTWTVWLETLWPALGTVAIQLLSFGPGDILRGYFRPSSTRAVGGLTRKPGRRRPLKASKLARARNSAKIPELGNEVGKKLPGSQFFASRKVTGVEARLWQIDMVTQRFLWYWLVADITSDFATNWTTAIYRSEACLDNGRGTIIATDDDSGAHAPGIWSAVLGWDVEVEIPPGVFNGVTGQITPPFGWTIICSLTGRFDGILGTTPTDCQMMIGNPLGNPDNDIVTPISSDPRDDPLQPVLFGATGSESVFGVLVRAENSTFYHVRDVKLTVSLKPPP